MTPDNDDPTIAEDLPEEVAPDSTEEESSPDPAESAAEAAAEAGDEGDEEIPEIPLTPEQELDRWRDLALRSRAELDNYRKRVSKEKADSFRYANSSLLTSLFPILDSFQMGLDEARKESEESMIFLGMNMVRNQLDGLLQDFSVKEIGAAGEAFDPNLHEAIATEPHPEGGENGQILRVSRIGYQLHDRLLRAAQVVVSGDPEPEESAEADEGDSESADGSDS